MRSYFFRLSIALLAFSIGAGVSTVYINSQSVDRRFADALSKFYSQDEDECIAYLCRNELSSSVTCERVKSAKAEVVADSVTKDITNTNLGCKADNLSENECSQRKEHRMRDIEASLNGKSIISQR